MDLRLAKGGLDFALKNKRWVLLAATSFGAFRVYHSPQVAKSRRRIFKALGALVSILEAASDSAEAASVVSRDLRDFLKSESDQIPNSLKQISKIAKSDEVSLSIIRFTQALTVGLLRGVRSDPRNGDGDNGSSSFTDQVMDKLFTKAGSGFASTVVGSFARNLVRAFYSDELSGEGLGSKSDKTSCLSKWVDVVCGDDGRKLIGDCVQLFVSTAVAVYLEKTMNINTFDEFITGLTNPKHEKKVKDVLVSVCNGAVETLVKTSHQASKDSGSYRSFGVDEGKGDTGLDLVPTVGLRSRRAGGSWVSRVSSTLSLPGNRRFIVDLTGRVTFETVRSLLELLLEKLNERMRWCGDAVMESGIEAVKYVTVKTSVVASLCISLCLHILEAPWLLVPAY